MKKLTYQMLLVKNACKGQVELFKELFPNGAEVSVDVAVSVYDKFDFSWAARSLLTKDGFLVFEKVMSPHRKAYEEAAATHRKALEEAIATHRKAYNEAVAPHWKAYNEAVALCWKAYKEAVAPHQKAYEEAVAPHWEAFMKVRAKIFAEIYIRENNNDLAWDKSERLDELGVTGVQRDFVMDLLQVCGDVFKGSMTPTVGINENGDVGVTIQGVSGTINITITRDCYVFFAGDLRTLKGDKDGTTN